ncbi:MAG: hypothetical protein ACPIOQ_45290 [Promethearchaeia archaeon]
MHRSGNAKVAARRLVETALNAGTTDNVGVVVVDLRHIWDPSPPPRKPASTGQEKESTYKYFPQQNAG